MHEQLIIGEVRLDHWGSGQRQYLQQMLPHLECLPKAIFLEGWPPRMALQNTLDAMQQRIEDLRRRQIGVGTGEHELMQVGPQEHLETAEHVGIQRLEQARGARRYNHWPYVEGTAGSEGGRGKVADMRIHEQNGLTVFCMLLQDFSECAQNLGKDAVVDPC